MQLILASASPRRKELLSLFHIPFTVSVADIDETMDPALPPEEEVARVSRLKALAIPREEDDTVIAADTIVVCGGRVLGKPRTVEEAAGMLSLLSGRDHQVMTGCTVLTPNGCETFTEITDEQGRQVCGDIIPGLYVAGNMQGGRFGLQYPIGLKGVSHAMAMYYGKVAGENAVSGI